MFGRGRLVLVAGLVLLVVIVAIAAYMAFGAVAANVMARTLPEGQVPPPGAVAPYYYGPYGFHPFGFGFGPLGCLIPLLFFFLIFGAMRMLFWPRWWGMGRGGWGWHAHGGPEDWPDWMKERAEEWHRRMHGEESQPKAEDKA